MIGRIIVGALWKPIAAALAFAGLWLKLRSDAKARADLQDAKEELEGHDRITDADLGLGATDGDRVKRLREFADRHGER
jgi:hypothetical protein